jgi:hypothetical protein
MTDKPTYHVYHARADEVGVQGVLLVGDALAVFIDLHTI